MEIKIVHELIVTPELFKNTKKMDEIAIIKNYLAEKMSKKLIPYITVKKYKLADVEPEVDEDLIVYRGTLKVIDNIAAEDGV